jgi:hypothetical protein
MSDVMKKILDHELPKQEDQTVVELTENELEEVNGAEWGFGFPFTQNNSFAITSLAFTNNNAGVF